MSIVVTCQCGSQFAAEEYLAGQSVGCPTCGGAILIPAAAVLPPQIAPSPVAINNPYSAPPLRRRAQSKSIPGGAVTVAVMGIILGSMSLIGGGFALLVGTWIGSLMGSVAPAQLIAGPVLTWTLALLLYIVYGGLLIAGSIGLLKLQFWGWIMSLVTAGLSAAQAVYYLWAYFQLQRAVSIADRAVGDRVVGRGFQALSQETGLDVASFLLIAIFAGHAVLSFILLLIPYVSEPYRH